MQSIRVTQPTQIAAPYQVPSAHTGPIMQPPQLADFSRVAHPLHAAAPTVMTIQAVASNRETQTAVADRTMQRMDISELAQVAHPMSDANPSVVSIQAVASNRETQTARTAATTQISNFPQVAYPSHMAPPPPQSVQTSVSPQVVHHAQATLQLPVQTTMLPIISFKSMKTKVPIYVLR